MITLFALLGVYQAPISGVVTLASGKPVADAVVWLEDGTKSKPLKNVVIDQRDRKFIPRVTVVTVGTVVQLPNHDTVTHNVFTKFHTENFDVGMYPRGASKPVRFDKVGVSVLLCSIHPEMGAFVMCVDTPYFAKTDRKGRFTIPNVPRGRYTVRGWHEVGGETTFVATLPSSDLALTLKR